MIDSIMTRGKQSFSIIFAEGAKLGTVFALSLSLSLSLSYNTHRHSIFHKKNLSKSRPWKEPLEAPGRAIPKPGFSPAIVPGKTTVRVAG
jgi:hypothetical protein